MGDIRRAAVLGSPIAHSLSPILHRAAYRALGLSGWTYQRIECDETAFAATVAGMRAADGADGAGGAWAGLSLTMPLKRVALEHADEISAVAAAIGAANTYLPTSTGWRADNTDVDGIVLALRDAGVDAVESAVILGAGGTAQAALAAVVRLGCRAPTVLVRELARTHALAATAERLGASIDLRGELETSPLPPAQVVISTLPSGAADDLRVSGVRVVLDVVYAPWPTRFAAHAHADGAVVVSGLDMLLHQAAAQVTLMTGRRGPVGDMRAALSAARE